jgi:hypothetical protein
MLTTVAALAGLALGVIGGLLAKPSKQLFCERHGVTLGCPCCLEVSNGAPRSAQ